MVWLAYKSCQSDNGRERTLVTPGLFTLGELLLHWLAHTQINLQICMYTSRYLSCHWLWVTFTHLWLHARFFISYSYSKARHTVGLFAMSRRKGKEKKKDEKWAKSCQTAGSPHQMHQWVQGVQGQGAGFMTTAEHKYKLRMWNGNKSVGQKKGKKMHILQKINVNVS